MPYKYSTISMQIPHSNKKFILSKFPINSSNKMFVKKLFINFSILLIAGLSLKVNAGGGNNIAVPDGPISEAVLKLGLGFELFKHNWQYGDIRGFGDKDPNQAVQKVEYTVRRLAESIGLPLGAEQFEVIRHEYVLKLVAEKLQGVEAKKIPGLSDPETVLSTIEELEKLRAELKGKLDAKREDGTYNIEEVVKEFSAEVRGIYQVIEKVEETIKSVLEAAHADALNASAAAEYFVMKFGRIMVPSGLITSLQDEYMRRKANEVDGTVLVKVYTQSEAALREKFEEISEKVKFEQIYDKVLGELNSSKEPLTMWNEHALFNRNAFTKPRHEVESVLSKLKIAKGAVDKKIIGLPSGQFQQRAVKAHNLANEVRALNKIVLDLVKIIAKKM